MRSNHTLLLVAAIAMAACSKADQRAMTTRASASRDPDIKWGPAPPMLPAGAQIAVLQGDPSKSEPFTVRLKFPNSYKIPPHTHPTVENVTVLSGTFLAGMGTHFDDSQLKAFGRDASPAFPPTTRTTPWLVARPWSRSTRSGRS